MYLIIIDNVLQEGYAFPSRTHHYLYHDMDTKSLLAPDGRRVYFFLPKDAPYLPFIRSGLVPGIYSYGFNRLRKIDVQDLSGNFPQILIYTDDPLFFVYNLGYHLWEQQCTKYNIWYQTLV